MARFKELANKEMKELKGPIKPVNDLKMIVESNQKLLLTLQKAINIIPKEGVLH